MSSAARTEALKTMDKAKILLALALFCFAAGFPCAAQERKLEKIRVGGGSVGAPQMTMWFAKEANFYEKHGLAVEAISIPGSSMALQAMLSGEVPIIQLGGTASRSEERRVGKECRCRWLRYRVVNKGRGRM